MASNITVSPLTPAIGAEIGNIDLRQVSRDEIADIRAALLEYKVVFFRDQTLTQAEHISFAREFGDLEIHPATPKSQSNPEVLHIAHGPESKGKENFWHSDVTWREKPSLGSILKAVEVPAVGGDTLFANMVMAYELLPDDIKEAITGQVAIHDIARVFAGRLNKSAEELRERYPPMEHPIVRTHPETGESVLYVNTAFTSPTIHSARVTRVVGQERQVVARPSFSLRELLVAQVRRLRSQCHRGALLPQILPGHHSDDLGLTRGDVHVSQTHCPEQPVRAR